jgi:hypothetical protein
LLKAQQQAGKYPFFVTEMNDGLNNIAPGGELHRDKAYAAAFMLHNVPLLTNLTLMSWWTFTDSESDQVWWTTMNDSSEKERVR